MAKIKPFKALRPTRDKVHLVATRPYYSYKKGFLKAKLQSNPYTFLRIINPEFDLPKELRKAKSQSERFQMVKNKYAEFIQRGILKQDTESHFYLYRQTFQGHAYTGIIAGASIDEYKADLIKKHEATITAREEMFVEYLDVVEYNAEPVLLCHRPSNDLNKLYEVIMADRPEFEFTTTDCITHEVWLIKPSLNSEIQIAFEAIDSTYIADGHHRSASSMGLFDRRKSRNNNHPNDSYFLSYLIDESKLKIFEYNRLIRTSESNDSSKILSEIDNIFPLNPLKELRNPIHEHEIIIVTADKSYSIIIPVDQIDKNHPVASLDAEILTQKILSPIIGIHDLKTDPHIDFIPGVESLEKLRKKMQKGNFNLAFLLYPVSMEQVRKVADAGLIMPPKSTWVEPKMRSGLTIYHLNE